MGDSKVSALPVLASVAGEDLVLVIDDPSGTPTSKRITIQNMFASLPSNTNITGTFSATGNTTISGELTVANSSIQISTKSAAPASNNATTEFGAGSMGTIVYDDNYLYIASSNTVIKRVPLNVFT